MVAIKTPPKSSHRFLIVLIVVTVWLLHISLSDAGQKTGLPTPLLKAAKAYKVNGAYAFMPALFGGPLPAAANTAVTNQVETLKQVESVYGAFLGLEFVNSIKVSGSTRIVFYVMRFRRGPLYGVLTAYRTTAGEVITGFKVHTEIHKIMPPTMLVGIRQR